MIICIEVGTTNRNITMFFEIEDLPVEEIKKRVFDAFVEALKSYTKEFLSETKKHVLFEPIFNSEEFINEMEKRGFKEKKIEADITFTFWGWNSPSTFMSEPVSTELDREPFEYLKKIAHELIKKFNE